MCAITASSGRFPQLVHLNSSKLISVKSTFVALSRTKSLHDTHLVYNVDAFLMTSSAKFTHELLPQLGQRNLIAQLLVFSLYNAAV
jgi:hypothetical protein